MASHTTNTAIFPSIDVGGKPFVDQSPSQQYIREVSYGGHNDTHISMLSQAAYAPPNFLLTTAYAQVSRTLQFHHSFGAL